MQSLRPFVVGCACWAAILALGSSTQADVPRLVSYQGRLAGVGTADVNLTVTLYNAAAGGIVQFTETHLGVSVEKGIFAIQIGSQTAGGVPDTALDTTETWLGVSVNGGAELTPRTRIGMVPFAAKGRAAERLVPPGAFTIAADVNSSGNISLPSSAGPGGKLIFGIGNTPLITAGHNNAAANAKRMWIGHSESSPTWGIQYRDIVSDGFTADTLELVAGDQTKPRFSFELSPGNFRTFTSAGTNTFELKAAGGTSGGSRLRMLDSGGGETLNIDGDYFGAAVLHVNNATNTEAVRLDGLAGEIWVFDAGATTSSYLNLDAGFSQTGAAIQMADDAGTETVEILAAGSATTGAYVRLRDADGNTNVVLDGEGSTGGGEIYLYNGLGTYTIEIDGEDGDDAGTIRLRSETGATNITLDANYLGTGNGRVITDELQITGGSDLSENFNINPARGNIAAACDADFQTMNLEPGLVVCIDTQRTGELVVSHKAYDRTVAGVISGAGGIKPGMLMGQPGTAADGKHPVALTGRVYVWCDAANGAIQPGDLLTTSDTPGHAMKVVDHAQAQGTIIGKAMSSLENGKGLVLVLVSLQ